LASRGLPSARTRQIGKVIRPRSNFPATATGCGYTVWYIVDRTTTNCTARGGNATWNPGFVWSGRGWVHMDFQVPCANATSQIYVRYRNQAGTYTGQSSTINECAYGDWMTPLDQVTRQPRMEWLLRQLR